MTRDKAAELIAAKVSAWGVPISFGWFDKTAKPFPQVVLRARGYHMRLDVDPTCTGENLAIYADFAVQLFVEEWARIEREDPELA